MEKGEGLPQPLFFIPETCLKHRNSSSGLNGCVTVGKSLTVSNLSLSVCNNGLPRSLNSGRAFPDIGHYPLWVAPLVSNSLSMSSDRTFP